MNAKQIKIFTIPNTITLLNLLSGCLAIIYAFYGELIIASLLIFAAGIFDFLDGMAARLLKSYSELGKQLDSLADGVSFGVAPSIIIFCYYQQIFKQSNPDFSFLNANFPQQLLLISAFIIALFSALRLAKFNIDERQSDSFIGVPTPANAFFIASLPFVIEKFPALESYVISVYFLLPATIILSILLISEIPLISLKFKNLHFADNKLRYIFLGASILLLLIFQIAAFPVIFITYLLISIFGQNMNI
jgi:CDP-diacylglycerol---serine O-phosphatidyltransferase